MTTFENTPRKNFRRQRVIVNHEQMSKHVGCGVVNRSGVCYADPLAWQRFTDLLVNTKKRSKDERRMWLEEAAHLRADPYHNAHRLPR